MRWTVEKFITRLAISSADNFKRSTPLGRSIDSLLK
jgi:hypothetical protein